jgi:hypothetical protein
MHFPLILNFLTYLNKFIQVVINLLQKQATWRKIFNNKIWIRIFVWKEFCITYDCCLVFFFFSRKDWFNHTFTLFYQTIWYEMPIYQEIMFSMLIYLMRFGEIFKALRDNWCKEFGLHAQSYNNRYEFWSNN